MVNDSNFAQWLKTTIKGRGMTQAELARKSGLAPQEICQYAKGHRVPSFFNLTVIAETLGYEIELVKKGESA